MSPLSGDRGQDAVVLSGLDLLDLSITSEKVRVTCFKVVVRAIFLLNVKVCRDHFTPLGGDNELRRGDTLRRRGITTEISDEWAEPAGLRPRKPRPLAPIPSVRLSADCKLASRNSRSRRAASDRVNSASVALRRPCASLSCSCICADASTPACARKFRFLNSSCSFFSEPRTSCS